MTTHSIRSVDPLAPLLLAVTAVGLFLSGASPRDSAVTTVLVAFQVLIGLSLWRLATWRRQSNWVEALGASAVIAIALTAAASQLGRLLNLPQFAWLALFSALPLAVAAKLWRDPPTHSFSPTPRRTTITLLTSAVGLFVLYWPWFMGNPLQASGWRSLFVDVPFFESLGSSLVTWGPTDNNMVAGVPVRYHWLTYAWTGATQSTSLSEPFVVISRVAPLVLGMAVLLLGFAWINRMTNSFTAASFALILLLTANDVGTGFGRVLFPESPSLILGGAFTLLGALLATMFASEPPDSSRSWVWMFLAVAGLSAAGAAAKVAVALVLIAGGALATLATWRSAQRKVMLVWTTAALFGSLVGFLLTAAGASGGTIALSPGGLAAQYEFAGLGLALGIVALGLAIAAPWAGLAILGTRRGWRQRPELWLVIGGAAAALLVAVMVDLGAGNQVQLPVVATAIAAPLSAAGVALAASQIAGTGAKVAASAASLALGMAAAVASQVLPLELRWSAPIGVALVGITAGFLFARNTSSGGAAAHWSLWVAATASVIVFASIGSGLVVTAYKYSEVWTSPPVTAESQLSWAEGDLAAANWVVENTSQSDNIASSRWCKQPVELTDEACGSYWWLTSALTGRQVLVEGSGYWISSEPREEIVPVRQSTVQDFLTTPTPDSASALAAQGVRWVWVDKRNTTLPSGLPYAPILYENERIQILKLTP